MSRVEQAWTRHLNPSFMRLLGVLGYGRVWSRAEDVWLWDDRGRRYLDALSGFGASSVGHNNPRLTSAIARFFEEQPLNLSHTGPVRHTAELATALARRCHPLSVVLPANGGAEGVEAALKLAIAATGRSALLSCEGGFHGTSLGTLGLMGHDRLRGPFESAIKAATILPYGDLDALREALSTRKFAAFLVEPLQAEGGVRAPPADYLSEAAELCHRAGTLLIFDEVQTGLGRLGTMFEPVVPDVRVLGKALGGGLIPVSAAITRPEHFERAYGRMDRFDLHSSTYGGGALGCAVALESLAILEELTPRVNPLGERLIRRLRNGLHGHPFVLGVRGSGLLVGVELGPASGRLSRLAPRLIRLLSRQVYGQWLAVRLLEAGVVAQPAALAWNVLRIEPPLTIQEPQLDAIADAVIGVLSEVRSMRKMITELGSRLGEQALNGGQLR